MGKMREESLRPLSGCAVRAAWRTRPRPPSGNDVCSCRELATSRQQMCVAAVLGRPPTCAYADMNRLKSNGAILRREFVPRDPWRTNQL